MISETASINDAIVNSVGVIDATTGTADIDGVCDWFWVLVGRRW